MEPNYKVTNHQLLESAAPEHRTFRETTAIKLVCTRLDTYRPDVRGRPTQCMVEVVTDSRRFPLPAPICWHSPTGFEWGYGGSGPADLAANILALFVPIKEAWRLHQSFKSEVIARISEDGGELTAPAIRSWIEQQWALDD